MQGTRARVRSLAASPWRRCSWPWLSWSIFLAMALPAWRTAAQREKETELIFRGQQYARAIALFQRKYANTFPPNLNILLDQHFLRKKYRIR